MCNTGHETNTEMFSSHTHAHARAHTHTHTQKQNSFVKHDSNGVDIYLIQLFYDSDSMFDTAQATAM
jgi:hypothetical protein